MAKGQGVIIEQVVWVKEWLEENKGRPYANQHSTSQAIQLRNAVVQFKTQRTYENAVDVQKYTRQLADRMKENLK